jgi:Site-specific recombinase XerD
MINSFNLNQILAANSLKELQPCQSLSSNDLNFNFINNRTYHSPETLVDESLMVKFRNDCLSRNMEEKTANQYVSYSMKFCEYVGIKKIKQLDKDDYLSYYDDFDSFINYLYGKGLKQHTVSVYFNSLENLFNFLVFHRYIRMNPVPFFRKRFTGTYKAEEPEQSYVPRLKEMAEFIDSIDDPSIKGAVVVGSKCMLRLWEMLNMKKPMLDIKSFSAIVPSHKKRSNTLVFYDDETVDVLNEMIAARKPGQFLFVQENGRPYSAETFRRHLQKYAVDFGIYDPEAPRQLNFTFISTRRLGVTQFMKTSIPPTYISFLRGDKIKKSKDIKEIYFDIDREDVQEKYNQHVFKFWGNR